MDKFFYTISDIALVHGNKSSGFTLSIRRAAIRKLLATPLSMDVISEFNISLCQQLIDAGMKKLISPKFSGMTFFNGSACPLSFTANSIGAVDVSVSNTSDFEDLMLQEDYDSIPVFYSPHNVDAPDQAIVLMLMVHFWAEWAWVMHLSR